MCMVSYLEAPDQMTETILDGGSGIDEGICLILGGFGIRSTTTVEKERIHDVTEETNRRSMLAPFRGGQVATP